MKGLTLFSLIRYTAPAAPDGPGTFCIQFIPFLAQARVSLELRPSRPGSPAPHPPLPGAVPPNPGRAREGGLEARSPRGGGSARLPPRPGAGSTPPPPPAPPFAPPAPGPARPSPPNGCGIVRRLVLLFLKAPPLWAGGVGTRRLGAGRGRGGERKGTPRSRAARDEFIRPHAPPHPPDPPLRRWLAKPRRPSISSGQGPARAPCRQTRAASARRGTR